MLARCQPVPGAHTLALEGRPRGKESDAGRLLAGGAAAVSLLGWRALLLCFDCLLFGCARLGALSFALFVVCVYSVVCWCRLFSFALACLHLFSCGCGSVTRVVCFCLFVLGCLLSV